MTASNNISDHNMAENISQQTLMVNRHIDSLPPAVILTTETGPPIEKPNSSSSDILQLALSEADGYEQNPSSQNFQKMELDHNQHLSDHSYIHTKAGQLVSRIVDETYSEEIDYISESEVAQTLEPKSIPFESTPISLSEDLFSKNSSQVSNSLSLGEMDVLSSETGESKDLSQNSHFTTIRIEETFMNDNSNSVISPVNVSMGTSINPELPPLSLEQQYSIKTDVLTVPVDTASVTLPDTTQIPSNSFLNNCNILIKPVSLQQRFFDKLSQQKTVATPAAEGSLEHSQNMEHQESNAPMTASGVTSQTSLPSCDQQILRDTQTPVTTATVTAPHFLRLPVTKQSEKPVGSQDNPIKLILHGNAYHPTQTLTKVQVEAIASILQRNRITNVFQDKVQNGCRSIIFDQPTKTRIVCRSLNPTELAGRTSSDASNGSLGTEPSTSNPTHSSSSKRRGRPKKSIARKSSKEEPSCSLTKEEREERKKQRLMTRSGRISKPPSIYVKDYKRIHHLDYNEDTSSDGGYSDYHVSDGEIEPKPTRPEPGVTTSKRREHSCPSCFKAYIGPSGLSRHFRRNPTHKNKEPNNCNLHDDTSNTSLTSSVKSSCEGNTNNQSVANTSSQNILNITQVDDSSLNHQPTYDITHLSASSTMDQNGSQPIHTELSSINHLVNSDISDSSVPSINHQQNRLKEILQSFTDEDLCEVLLPKFAQKVSLWDFFVKKCSEKDEKGLLIYEMLKEFEKFMLQLQRFSHACLTPASFEDPRRNSINISGKQIADALSLETGIYFTTDPTPLLTQLPLSSYTPPLKRKRLEETVPENLQSILDLNSAGSTTVTPSALSTGCLPAVHFDPVGQGVTPPFLEMDPLVGGLEDAGCLPETVPLVNNPIIIDSNVVLEENQEFEVNQGGERIQLILSNGQIFQLSGTSDLNLNIQQTDQVPHSQLPDI